MSSHKCMKKSICVLLKTLNKLKQNVYIELKFRYSGLKVCCFKEQKKYIALQLLPLNQSVSRKQSLSGTSILIMGIYWL